METLIGIFGKGQDLSMLQMSCRGVVIFFVTLILIRISGRRSFGMRTPLDNIIVILLGAILGRAVVGASPVLPIVVTGFIIVLLHRMLAMLSLKNKSMSAIIEGKKILLFEKGAFIKKNLDRAIVSQEEVQRTVRKQLFTASFEKIDKIYIEANGEISLIKKEASAES